jgi:hypothetical protein
MKTASVFLPHPAERCWRAFMDVSMLRSWVPGLKRARLVRANDAALPLEVSFELGDTLTYTLVYHYEGEHAVRWEPRVGKRDGLRGSARFEPEGDGCRLHYELEPLAPHSSPERADEDPARLTSAFAAWLARPR